MKKTLVMAALVMVAVATGTWAQEETPQGIERYWAHQLFKLKHADPVTVQRVLSPLGGVSTPDRELRVILWKGPKELLPAVEKLVASLDVPPPLRRGVQLTFHLLVAGKDGRGTPLPAELEGVGKQVRELFGLEKVALLETLAMRTTEGSAAELTGAVRGFGNGPWADKCRLQVRQVSLAADERGTVVQLKGLRFDLTWQIATGPNVTESGSSMESDIDVREGQKAVLGKLSAGAAGDTVFVVTTARVE